MLLAFDNKNNGFISIKNVLTRQGRCSTFELLNGETLATISFEELCAQPGLSEAARALGGSPVEASPGKLLLLLFRGKSGLTGADDRSFFAVFLRCAVRSNFSI
ncbi:hypothetical protein [Microcoleus sp. OTE_8_concoct_300]|uniref:hypothetical protein n=1 Tax=Microcoleus sp. OTE_8_concoct_300 TaxID=2964710 RepID=UPI00403FA814